MKSSARPSLLLALTLILCGGIYAGCGSGADSRSLSEEHLRNGIRALDNEDDSTADGELRASLSINPREARARTALASLRARRAGVDAHGWIDPILNALTDLQSSNTEAELLQMSRQLSLAVIDPDKADWVRAEFSAVSDLMLQVAAFSSSFSALPHLDAKQIGEFGSAIDLLREEDAKPEGRSSEVRLYLTILSVIELKQHTNEVLLNPITGRVDFDAKRVCSMNTDKLIERIKGMHLALEHLREGLARSPDDADTSARNSMDTARKRIGGLLDNQSWKLVDSMTKTGSLQGEAERQAARKYCGIIAKSADPAAAPSPSVTSAAPSPSPSPNPTASPSLSPSPEPSALQ